MAAMEDAGGGIYGGGSGDEDDRLSGNAHARFQRSAEEGSGGDDDTNGLTAAAAAAARWRDEERRELTSGVLTALLGNAGGPAPAGVASEGVAWGEEALSFTFSSCKASSPSSPPAAADAAENADADPEGRTPRNDVAEPAAAAFVDSSSTARYVASGSSSGVSVVAAEHARAMVAAGCASRVVTAEEAAQGEDATAAGISWVDPGSEGKGPPLEDLVAEDDGKAMVSGAGGGEKELPGVSSVIERVRRWL